MSTRKSFLSGTSALLALQNEKTKSLLIRREVKIVNELGLHARPAAEFVLAAKAFRSQIWLIKAIPNRFKVRRGKVGGIANTFRLRIRNTLQARWPNSIRCLAIVSEHCAFG